MTLKRRQLFEFEDQGWVPRSVRVLLTRSLQRMNATMGVYDAVAPVLTRALQHTRTPHIIDLCSGAGGPWERLYPIVASKHSDIKLTLTDRHPQPEAIASWTSGVGSIEYSPAPVDATDVPSRFTGVHTIFTGFHHFSPPLASQILRNAASRRSPIAVFEFTRRRLSNVMLAALAGGLGVPLVVPGLRPLRAAQLLWTYLFPLGPLAYAWDGAVSNLRTYTQDELREMGRAVSRPDYVFEVGELPTPRLPTPITYLLGLPLREAKRPEA